MRILLAVIINLSLLAWLLPWLRRQWQWAATGPWRAVLVLGFGLRVGMGLARYWSHQLDARGMSSVSDAITNDILWTDPAHAWRMLTGAVTVIPTGTYDAVFQNTSNTWFLIKMLVILNLGSLTMGWLNTLYLSLFAFVGCWILVRKLAQVLPNTPAGAGVIGFLMWPSIFFWATGISKEAVLLGSGAWLTARVVGRLYDAADDPLSEGASPFLWWLGTAALAFMHFQMRYFFAAPLLGVLGGMALGHWLNQHRLTRARWVQAVVMATVLGAVAWVAPQLSVAFRMNKFTNQVVRVYTFEVSHTEGQPHFEYPNLRPTIESIAAYAPLAVVNALTRPWLGESKKPLYLAAGLENAAVLALMALAALAALRGRIGNMPFALCLALGLFCLILTFLIGLTTPNLGSLNRYRSEILPFLLLLLLQNEYAAKLLSYLKLGRGNETRLVPPETPSRPAA
ncbi:hypothetical protein [Hymenobacter sp. UYCo722]|uniref:hypothetical protein n=1 Tax=Hymenobacter sp. UYCo722 TaxID=3156335 RepID=UPI0033980B99